jgi:spore coat protein U-like protein
MILLSSSFVLFAGGASEISFSQEDTSEQVLIDYDVLLPDSPETLQAGLKRTLNGGIVGEVFSAENTTITFSAGSSGQIEQRTLTHTEFPSHKLDYNIYRDPEATQILTDSVNAQNGYLLEYRFPRISVQRFQTQQQFAVLPFYLQVTPNQFLRAGTYTDSIDLNVYTSGDSSIEGAMLSIEIEVTVSQFVGINVGDINVFDPQYQGGYGMDFETLQSYESLSTNVVALANVPYTIRASSANNGSMKHESLDEYIPYEFSFAQSLADLTGSQTNPIVVLESTDITSSTGDVYQIEVEIGYFDWKPAGDYHDTISFEIEAY